MKYIQNNINYSNIEDLKSDYYVQLDDFASDYLNQSRELSRDFNKVELQYQKELKKMNDSVVKGELDLSSKDYFIKNEILKDKFGAYLDTIKIKDVYNGNILDYELDRILSFDKTDD